MRYLITGGCGFLGSNLAGEVLNRGEDLLIFDNLSRVGSSSNLEWLKSKGSFCFVHGDIRSASDISRVVSTFQPDVVFHLAGQVAMTTSLENPRLDFEINALGTFNLLEAVRNSTPNAIVIYSSTNKVYGDLENFSYKETPTRWEVEGFPEGFDEEVGFDFRSPYGCSKGAADQYMLDFARNFGLRTIVFRHSSIFGGRQFSTFDQGWVGWFIKQAILTKKGALSKPFTISGDGKQVRDVLFASDLIRCYFLAVEHWENSIGKAYNIGGGYQNSLSLLELFSLLEDELNVKLSFSKIPWRANDQKVFIANSKRARQDFGWFPQIGKNDGIKLMIQWVKGTV
jgi:CDP-paratose 2-epimerase